MSNFRPIIARPCEAQNASCPGAHACLYAATGNWRICAGAIFEHEALACSNQQRNGNGQELAA